MNDEFQQYSKMLDEKNDKNERIYKLNRDVTMKSKKIIFSLHRIPGMSSDEKEKILSAATKDFEVIDRSLHRVIGEELVGQEAYQYIGAYSGGVQEYIEAVAFHHFLQNDEIISHSKIQERLTFTTNKKDDENIPDQADQDSTFNVFIPAREYILGLADLTGELMRYCIKSLSTGDFDVCYRICDILKLINAGFLSLGHVHHKELNNKINVFRSSLDKVEQACYTLELRKSELPPGMELIF